MLRTRLSILRFAQGLLALLLFTTLAAGPARVALALAHGAPGSDLCSALHGTPASPLPAGPAKEAASCAACAFCAVPPMASAPSCAAPGEPRDHAVRPASATFAASGPVAFLRPRVRGPPGPA